MASYYSFVHQRNLLVALLVSLLATLNLTCAHKCYQCQLKDGVGDAGCGENPPPEKYLRTCAQPQCWLRYSSNGTLSIERFCVAVATNVNGCIGAVVQDTKGMQHSAMECRCNDSDGCNGNTPSGIGGSGGGHYESSTEHHN